MTAKSNNLDVALRLLVPLITIPLLLVSCNDQPSTVGSDFLPETVEFFNLEIPSEGMTVESGIAKIPNSSSEGVNAMLVGSAPDGTVAHGLLSLIERSDLLINVDPSEIVSSKLTLRGVNYRFGEIESRNASFDVVSFDGIFASDQQWHDTIESSLLTGLVVGNYDGDYADSTIMSVDLDPTETAHFLNDYYSLDTVISEGDTLIQTNTLKSIGLRSSSSSTMIGAFLGTGETSLGDSLLPTLLIELADTTIALRFGVSNWIGKLPSSFVTGPNAFALAGGIPVRTLIRFNLDSIPDNAAIHSAELTLQIVSNEEVFGSRDEVDFIVAYVAGDDPLGAEEYLSSFPVNFGRIFLRGSRPAIDSSSLESYVRFGQLGSTVAQWMLGERDIGSGANAIENNGLILALERTIPAIESATVDRLRFYGIEATDELRPRMRIVYSIQQGRN